ncbi:MAG TPA: PCRF domain-containing protein [Candidatus Azoamicus sp.]
MINLWCIFDINIYIKRLEQFDQFFNKISFKKNLTYEYISIDQIKLKNNISKIKHYKQELIEFNDYINMDKQNIDNELIEYVIKQLPVIKKEVEDLESENIFLDEIDISNAYFDIQAGSGGTDAQDWTNILLKMYTLWFTKKNFKYDIINISNGEVAGLKSVSIKVIGKYYYGWLKYETGVHRLVRKSPFDSNKKDTHLLLLSLYIQKMKVVQI